MDNNLFSQRLKEARLNAKLKQTELSKLSGVTAATISAYERADEGKGKNPSLENALKLAQALNVSLDWLCGLAVNNEKVQISDFLKMLVKLDKEGVYNSIDEVYVNRGYEVKRQCASITVEHDIITTFLLEWDKIRNLFYKKTINEDLYNLWLNQQYMKADLWQKQNENSINVLLNNNEDLPF